MNSVLFTYLGQTYLVEYIEYTAPQNQVWHKPRGGNPSTPALAFGLLFDAYYPDEKARKSFTDFITPQLVAERLMA